MIRDRRKNFRVEWNSPGTIYSREGGSGHPCIVKDLSNGGVKISGVAATDVPDQFTLYIDGDSKTRKCEVLWRKPTPSESSSPIARRLPTNRPPSEKQNEEFSFRTAEGKIAWAIDAAALHALTQVFPREQRSNIFRHTHLDRGAGSADALQFRGRRDAQDFSLRRCRRRICLRDRSWPPRRRRRPS